MCLEFFLEEKEDTLPEYPPQTTLFPSPHPPLHFPPMSVSFIALAPWGKGDGASPFSRWAVAGSGLLQVGQFAQLGPPCSTLHAQHFSGPIFWLSPHLLLWPQWGQGP